MQVRPSVRPVQAPSSKTEWARSVYTCAYEA